MKYRKKEANNSKEKKSIGNIIENIIFSIILIPLCIVTINIALQVFTRPDDIPNIFGYKIFMILDDYMDDSVTFGDLVITKNIDANILENGNIIAFRNDENTVTIHKIIDIKEKTNEENIVTRTFTMNTLPGETLDTKYVKDEKVEGILIKVIPKLGAVIFFIQQPLAMIGIASIIAMCGTIWIFIAEQLDKKDEERLKQQKEKQEEKTTV